MRVGPVPEPEGGVAAADQLADFAAERGAHSQIDARVVLAKAPEAHGQRGARERAHDGQRDGPLIRATQRPHRVDPVAHRGKQRLRVREKRAPAVGEDHAATDALEQRRPQLPLEEVNAAADRGLGQVQGRGGAGEPAAPHDRHERLHVVELHWASA